MFSLSDIFPYQNPVHVRQLPYACHMLCLSQTALFCHPTNICLEVKIMKLLIMQLPLVSCYFNLLTPKHPPCTLLSRTHSPCFPVTQHTMFPSLYRAAQTIFHSTICNTRTDSVLWTAEPTVMHCAQTWRASTVEMAFFGLLCHIWRGADKSFVRPTSQCRRTESIVSLEKGACSCVELQVFFVT